MLSTYRDMYKRGDIVIEHDSKAYELVARGSAIIIEHVYEDVPTGKLNKDPINDITVRGNVSVEEKAPINKEVPVKKKNAGQECEECGKWFATNQGLKIHRGMIHG